MASESNSSLVDTTQLAKEKWLGVYDLYQWEGFWYMLNHLEAFKASSSRLQAGTDNNDTIILVSSMKTGTTWLKALIPSIMNFSENDENDPLLNNHPNKLMPSLESQLDNKGDDHLIPASVRLFRTHSPFVVLPDYAKKSDRCKIVYITRDPKDAFVSLWHFMNANRPPGTNGPYPIDDAFESFCKGVHAFGPFHDHVLGYWKESLKRPDKILFMRYEEMKRNPREEVKKLAAFLGKPFAKEEDVDEVVKRCSLERLKGLEVNKNGVDPWFKTTHKSYFRHGQVGDWKNSLTEEMKERLDEITRVKLAGSGFKF